MDPPRHRNGYRPKWNGEPKIPDSLEEAVRAFIYACAVRKLRGQARHGLQERHARAPGRLLLVRCSRCRSAAHGTQTKASHEGAYLAEKNDARARGLASSHLEKVQQSALQAQQELDEANVALTLPGPTFPTCCTASHRTRCLQCCGNASRRQTKRSGPRRRLCPEESAHPVLARSAKTRIRSLPW